MKQLKKRIDKFITLGLFITILAASPAFLLAQSKRLYGELNIIKNVSSANADDYVTVDGQRAGSGRSIISPSEVATPPSTSAKILFAQTGSVLISPNSRINLTFVDSSIAGDLTAGDVTIETIPDTTLNIFTRDGAITTPNRNQKNIVKISIVNGATRVDTLTGQVMVNNVLVSAGEFYPQTTNNTVDKDSSKGVNPLLIVGILGAVAGTVLIALAVSSNNNDNPTVSPTR